MLQLDAIDTAAAVATKGHAQAVIESGLIPLILTLMDADVACRLRGLSLLRELAWGAPQQIAALGRFPVVPALCKMLRHFKEYDQVLREVYKHQEASYNFDLLRTVVGILSRLLDGAQSAATAPGTNAVAAQLDMESVDHLQAVRC